MFSRMAQPNEWKPNEWRKADMHNPPARSEDKAVNLTELRHAGTAS